MLSIKNFKNHSFLVYGLGLTGRSVVNFFKKNNINNYKVWDDKKKKLFKSKRAKNLLKTLKEVDHIVLSPGVNFNTTKNRNYLKKYYHKIITDIDLIFVLKHFLKSIVVTGTNGNQQLVKF